MAKTIIYKTENGKKQVLSFYENLLSQWHQPSSQLNIETTFGETFIVESGKKGAQAILLLHGSGSNSAMWIADVIELSSTYHVFAIDIIGECGKSSENRPDFSNGNYSDWISEIIEKLALNCVSIIACSIGGWIALDFATKHPDKIEKLILMATAGVTQLKFKTIFWIMITSVMGSWGFQKLNKMVYGNLEIDRQALEYASLIKKHYKPRTDILPVFNNESLQQIKTTVLFIGGENDCFYDSNKTAARLEENINKVKCIVLKNVGHVLIHQTDKILKFLKD